MRCRPDFCLVASAALWISLLLQAPAGSEQKLTVRTAPVATWLRVRGSGSDDLTSGVAHSHVGLAIAFSPTTRATAYVELGARELGGAVGFSPKRQAGLALRRCYGPSKSDARSVAFGRV